MTLLEFLVTDLRDIVLEAEGCLHPRPVGPSLPGVESEVTRDVLGEPGVDARLDASAVKISEANAMHRAVSRTIPARSSHDAQVRRRPRHGSWSPHQAFRDSRA